MTARKRNNRLLEKMRRETDGTWLIEIRRWDMNTMKQIVTRKTVIEGDGFDLCSEPEHSNCKHQPNEMVLRKGSYISSVNVYPALRKTVLYIRTPQERINPNASSSR